MHVAWHGCAAWSYEVVRARMDVKEGEEICISYLAEAQHLLTRLLPAT